MRTYRRGRRRRRHRWTLVKYRTVEKQEEEEEEAVGKEDYVSGGVMRGRGNEEKKAM